MDAAVSQSLAELRPALLKIARLQLRNDTWAEDVVSETLIAALEGAGNFAGQSQLKTWVVAFLKHKIIDHFRKYGREVSADARMEASQAENFDDLFHPDGHFVGRPLPTWGDPEASQRQSQFMAVLQACIDKLPANQGRIFMMREWLDLDTGQVCKELGVTSTNAFVLLYRARMKLRECLEQNWFGRVRSR
jgi:RNA polymerase sigma-70 factor (ECF subfamily)